MTSRVTPRDELRATAAGERARCVARAHELGIILTVLGESIPSALDTTDDVMTMAIRLRAIVEAGAATLNDLAQIAGRMQTLGALSSGG